MGVCCVPHTVHTALSLLPVLILPFENGSHGPARGRQPAWQGWAATPQGPRASHAEFSRPQTEPWGREPLSTRARLGLRRVQDRATRQGPPHRSASEAQSGSPFARKVLFRP